jgi:isoleucyl-tRNA synthetase
LKFIAVYPVFARGSPSVGASDRYWKFTRLVNEITVAERYWHTLESVADPSLDLRTFLQAEVNQAYIDLSHSALYISALDKESSNAALRADYYALLAYVEQALAPSSEVVKKG